MEPDAVEHEATSENGEDGKNEDDLVYAYLDEVHGDFGTSD